MTAPPRALRRPLILVGGLLAALAVAVPASAATSATTVSANVNTVLSVSAPATLDFGSVNTGDTPNAQADVAVVSNVSNGYTLTASRTAFSNGDISLAFMGATAPANTTTGTTGAILTSGSRTIGIGQAGFVTAQLGSHWLIDLGLGPVPFTLDGDHSSTVTFTATATP